MLIWYFFKPINVYIYIYIYIYENQAHISHIYQLNTQISKLQKNVLKNTE